MGFLMVLQRRIANTKGQIKDERMNTGISEAVENAQNGHRPSILNVPFVAIDAGNRHIKWIVDGSPTPRCIPSIYADLEEWDKVNCDATSFEIEYLTGVDELRGKRWVVGSVAADLEGEPTFLSDKAILAKKLALVAVEPLNRHMVIKKLITCTPDDLKTEQVEAIKDSLTGIHTFKRNGETIIAHIISVEVQPETLGAFLWAKSQNFFKYDRPNAILDLGGKTGIAQIYSRNGTLIRDARAVLPGTYALAQSIASDPNFTRQIEFSPKPELVMDAIANETFVYSNTGVSFKEIFPKHQNKWLADIRNRIKSKWGTKLDDLGECLIIGGSAPLAQPLVDMTGGRFKISPEHQFANLRGMAA